MKDFKIDNKGSARLFSNSILERLTRTHFLIPVTFYFAISAGILFYVFYFDFVPLLSTIWIFPIGIPLFSLVEYFIHRYVFHFNAVTDNEKELQYNIHGVHHEFPRDKDRLVMPPVLSVTIALLFYLLFRFLLDRNGLVLFAGFSSGYSIYLLIHYYIHARKPPANFLKYLWTHHSLHHYHSVGAAYSVSFPFWDYLFGTMPPKTRKNSSALVDKQKA